MLQKINVVFSTVEKNQPVLQQLIQRRKIISEECPPRFANDAVFNVGKHLRDLLSNAPDNFSPRRLQLRQPRFNHVGLLAALEIFAALADPFLPFQNQIGELIGQFLSDEFQQAQPENEINLDVLVIFG